MKISKPSEMTKKEGRVSVKEVLSEGVEARDALEALSKLIDQTVTLNTGFGRTASEVKLADQLALQIANTVVNALQFSNNYPKHFRHGSDLYALLQQKLPRALIDELKRL